jgi:hypothetical protein
VWRHRQNEYDRQSPIIKEQLSTDDILKLEWVFDGTENIGKSPLQRVTKYYREDLKFMTLSVASTYAWANPADKRFWVERARHADMKKSFEEYRRTKLLMTKELGIPENYTPPPMTNYYGIYYFVKFRKRLAEIREYLISQLNEQVVQRFAIKNSLPCEIELRTVGYQSVDDIEAVFKQFEQQKLTADEVVKTLSA